MRHKTNSSCQSENEYAVRQAELVDEMRRETVKFDASYDRLMLAFDKADKEILR